MANFAGVLAYFWIMRGEEGILQVRALPRTMGSCTAEKMQRILANQLFSQHAKLNMASFVLYLLGHFGLKCRMVEFCAEAHSNQHSAISQDQKQQQKQIHFIPKRYIGAGAKGAEENMLEPYANYAVIAQVHANLG
jgi:hypothetical protein